MYSQILQKLDHKRLRRTLFPVDGPQGPHIQIEGKDFVNFASNDYLGLSFDDHLIQAAQEAASKWGTGSGASRLLSGSLGIHHELEEAIACFKREERALVFSSGFQTNLGILSSLIGGDDTVWVDRYSHASIVDGVKLSGGKLRVYPHRDIQRLGDAMRAKSSDRHWIVTDSYFSMDGDIAPLKDLVALAQKFDAKLVIDEAHATGVFGEHGRGITELFDVEGQVDVVVGTFSKALGSQGGFIGGSNEMIDFALNKTRSFIYSTAPSPITSAVSLAAIRLLEYDVTRRKKLWKNIKFLRNALQSKGFDLLESQGPIIPILIGNTTEALRISRELYKQAIWVPAIRPPTVPKNQDRLRVSVTSKHTIHDLHRLVEALSECFHDVPLSSGHGPARSSNSTCQWHVDAEGAEDV